jgi:hypothetical protein
LIPIRCPGHGNHSVKRQLTLPRGTGLARQHSRQLATKETRSSLKYTLLQYSFSQIIIVHVDIPPFASKNVIFRPVDIHAMFPTHQSRYQTDGLPRHARRGRVRGGVLSLGFCSLGPGTGSDLLDFACFPLFFFPLSFGVLGLGAVGSAFSSA